MKNIIKQKKGDVFQVIFMVALLLAIAIVGFITLTITTRVNEYWDSSGLLNETAVGTHAIDVMQDTAPKTTDYAIFFMFIGMNIGIIVAAVRTNFSATIIFLFILLTLIAIMFAAGAVNLYQGLAQQPSVIDVGNQLTLTNFIFSKYLPLIISMVCAFIMLLIWGKGGDSIVT
jgi:hypothetical protein